MSGGVPRRAIRFNVAVQIIAMAVLLVAVNYFSFNHYVRADFSRSQKFVLSEQTKRALRSLDKGRLRITVLFSPTSASPETALYGDVRNLLKELIFSSRFSGRKRIEVEFVDPTRDLSRARELQGRYKFNATENVLILEYDGRTEFVPAARMGDFDLTPVMAGEPPRLVAFTGEQAVTNAIIALTNPEKKKIYFLEGHGEPSIGEGSPVSVFLENLRRQNVSLAPLSLASIDSVPSDCAMLAILGSRYDLSEREAAIIEQYWAGQQGRLLVALDPDAKTLRLDGILARAGIIPMDNRVLRTVQLPFATGILRDVTGDFMPDSTVTKRLVDTRILLTGATQSLGIDASQAKTAGLQLWPLIRASEPFWGEADYITDEKKGVRYDDGRDVGYPVYLAVAAARGGVTDDRVQVESSKLVAVGNAQFVLDSAVAQAGQANLDFLSSASNWLLDRGALTGVIPKNVEHYKLSLSDSQMGLIALYTMVVMPGVAALLGLIAWLRRRA